MLSLKASRLKCRRDCKVCGEKVVKPSVQSTGDCVCAFCMKYFGFSTHGLFRISWQAGGHASESSAS